MSAATPTPYQLGNELSAGVSDRTENGTVTRNSDSKTYDTQLQEISQESSREREPNESHGVQNTLVSDSALSSTVVSDATSFENTISARYFLSKSMVLHYGHEFLCLLVLVLTTYATLQNGTNKVVRVPSPVDFFRHSSIIVDWPGGHLNDAQSSVASSDLAFVLFYAPWCTESQRSRIPFEHVAKLYQKEAYFTAINCWHPGGECRTKYQKVLSWPVLMGYLGNGVAVQYSGPLTNASLSKFVSSMLNPFVRIENGDDLLELMATHDSVVVAFIDMKDGKKFNAFYETAVRWHERDPFSDVKFAVLTGYNTEEFGVESIPSLRIYLWNETLVYDEKSWHHKHVHKWINKRMHQVSYWLSPPGKKASTLANHLKKGPAFLLFTPRNYYGDYNDAYLMMKQLAIEFNNCQNDKWIVDFTIAIESYRQEFIDNQEMLRKKCRSIMISEENSRASCGRRTVSVILGSTINSSKNYNDDKIYQMCNYLDHEMICPAENAIFNHMNRAEFYKKSDKSKISMLNADDYDNSPEKLRIINLRRKCQLKKLQDKHRMYSNFQIDDSSEFHVLSGLACKMNKTVTMLLVDSLLYASFARKLGANISSENNFTAAIIVDHNNEMAHVMNDIPTTNNIIKFIVQYSKNRLERAIVNKNTTDSDHYVYSADADYERRRIETTDGKQITIRDVTSLNFDRIVLQSNKTVIVLFYSLQCALCNLMSTNLLMVAKMLKEMPTIEFVRIDGDKNDLPWQYTMESFPTLLIFPAGRKSESRMYPNSLRISTDNLLNFVLANLKRSDRLDSLIFICSSSKKKSLIEECLNALKSEVQETIEVNLSMWRNRPLRRSIILRRLQKLKEFFLELMRISHSCDVHNLSKYLKTIRIN